MPSWPYTKLYTGPQHGIAISGPFIQVIGLNDGKILHTVRCDVVVTNSAVDNDFIHLLTIGDDKKLKVWKISGLQLESTRELPKKATQLSFAQNTLDTIIVADKFGDVFSYPLIPRITAPEPKASSNRDSLASHENPHGDLVLGHASIITCFTFTLDGRYIITADRDEHIRVSRFPHGYVIERYCLGHEQFVSAIHIPKFNPSVLISGGGDPYLSIWDWKSGEEKCQIPISDDVVAPFLKGRSTRTKWQKPKKEAPSTSRRWNKEAQNLEEEQEVERSINEELAPSRDEPLDQAILAVKKIDTFETEDVQLVVFSVVGGSALFYCRFTDDPSNRSEIRCLDLQNPILDFILTSDKHILVTIDSDWTSPNEALNTEPVLMVGWNNNELQILKLSSPFIKTLNGQAPREASAHEIAAMGLYDDLMLLPKRPDGPEEGEGETNSRSSTPGPAMGKRAARLKKQNHIRQRESGQNSSTNDRESKKMKVGEEG